MTRMPQTKARRQHRPRLDEPDAEQVVLGVLLDRMLIFGRRHLESVMNAYVDHHNAHRPHRSLGQTPPLGSTQPPVALASRPVVRRDRLGGLVGEYSQAG